MPEGELSQLDSYVSRSGKPVGAMPGVKVYQGELYLGSYDKGRGIARGPMSSESFTRGAYTRGSYARGSYTKGTYTRESYTKGSYARGSYTRGSYVRGSCARRN